MTTATATAADLRNQAAKHIADAAESFDRCDTDGFLSQWASDLNARCLNLQADIVENGGMASFKVLLDATTLQWVPAKLIDGKYGKSWMLLDSNGNRTGEYVSAFPARKSTIVNKGYIEGWGDLPAKSAIRGSGTGLAGAMSCYATTVRDCDDMTPPVNITVREYKRD